MPIAWDSFTPEKLPYFFRRQGVELHIFTFSGYPVRESRLQTSNSV